MATSSIETYNFPSQMKSYRAKTKAWKQSHLDWAKNKSFFTNDWIRASVLNKKINADLVNNILHMEDIALVVNPNCIEALYIPETIQHYPIINGKLELLAGEDLQRGFNYTVIVTNPEAISKKEEAKQEAIYQQLMAAIQDESLSEDAYKKEVERIERYAMYKWQDTLEMGGNAILQHYKSEYNMPYMFHRGLFDGLQYAEEMYRTSIRAGEPYLEPLDPLKVHAYRSGYSTKIEDADIIIIEDYLAPGKIIDIYYDDLTQEQVRKIENYSNKDTNHVDISEAQLALEQNYILDDSAIFKGRNGVKISGYTYNQSLMPYDMYGNIRVMTIFWKSKRKVKKVKSYDQQTGQEIYNIYTEDYICNPAMGEEESILWINEAWEGTLIGDDIYVRMQPMPVQHRRLSNPSDCHFGIIGSIYTLNNYKPISMVDILKPYAYLYDVIHDRLNRLLSENIGKVIQIDEAMVPKGKGWTTDKWLYTLKTQHIAYINSFNVGTDGMTKGKLAGPNGHSAVALDADISPIIQQYISMLEFIKSEIADVTGITPQRESIVGQRESVGGVERAVRQSNAITEWITAIHEDIKKRVLESFLDTAKVALKGNTMKFQYLLPDNVLQQASIDGDEFAEADYGVLCDDSDMTLQLQQNITQLAHAGLQSGLMDFSTMLKLFSTASTAEKIRLIERAEQQNRERKQLEMEQQNQIAQQEIQARAEEAEKERELTLQKTQMDNETRITVAQIQAQATQSLNDSWGPKNETDRQRLLFDMQKADKELELKNKEFELKRKQAKDDKELELKKIQMQKSKANTTSKR